MKLKSNDWRLQMKKLVGLLIGVLMLTACVNEEFSDSVEEFDIPNFSANVEIDHVLYPLAKGGYTWTEKSSFGEKIITTDHASPNQQAEGMEAIIVSKGAQVKVSIESEPDLTVFMWTDKGKDKKIAMKQNSFNVVFDQGVYVYEIVATWEQGYRSYVLKIEVQ